MLYHVLGIDMDLTSSCPLYLPWQIKVQLRFKFLLQPSSSDYWIDNLDNSFDMAPLHLLECRSASTRLASLTSDLEPEACDMDNLNIEFTDEALSKNRQSASIESHLTNEKSSSLLIAPKAARTLGWGNHQDAQKPVERKMRLKSLLFVLILSFLVGYHIVQVGGFPHRFSLLRFSQAQMWDHGMSNWYEYSIYLPRPLHP